MLGPARSAGLVLAVAACLLVACGSAENEDDLLACSMVLRGRWVPAPSSFNPRGIATMRLTPEDRARMRNERLWRHLAPGGGFDVDRNAFCGGDTDTRIQRLAVSRDGVWARADFVEAYQVETCLARRDGERWIERECDITLIADPI